MKVGGSGTVTRPTVVGLPVAADGTGAWGTTTLEALVREATFLHRLVASFGGEVPPAVAANARAAILRIQLKRDALVAAVGSGGSGSGAPSQLLTFADWRARCRGELAVAADSGGASPLRTSLLAEVAADFTQAMRVAIISYVLADKWQRARLRALPKALLQAEATAPVPSASTMATPARLWLGSGRAGAAAAAGELPKLRLPHIADTRGMHNVTATSSQDGEADGSDSEADGRPDDGDSDEVDGDGDDRPDGSTGMHPPDASTHPPPHGRLHLAIATPSRPAAAAPTRVAGPPHRDRAGGALISGRVTIRYMPQAARAVVAPLASTASGSRPGSSAAAASLFGASTTILPGSSTHSSASRGMTPLKLKARRPPHVPRTPIDDIIILFDVAGVLLPHAVAPTVPGGGRAYRVPSSSFSLHPATTVLMPVATSHWDAHVTLPATARSSDGSSTASAAPLMWPGPRHDVPALGTAAATPRDGDDKAALPHHVVNVRWPSARDIMQPAGLVGGPMLFEMAESGISLGTVAAVASPLAAMLALTSAVARLQAEEWWLVEAVGTRLLSLPTSHAAAMRRFQPFHLGPAPAPASSHEPWTPLAIDSFAAIQSGQIERVRRGLIETWHAGACAGVTTFAKAYAALLAALHTAYPWADAAAPSVAAGDRAASPGRTAPAAGAAFAGSAAGRSPVRPPSARTAPSPRRVAAGPSSPSSAATGGSGSFLDEPDLDAIASGSGPFALPISIRDQLHCDPRLRKYLRESLHEYAVYLARHKRLVQAANTVGAVANSLEATGAGSSHDGGARAGGDGKLGATLTAIVADAAAAVIGMPAPAAFSVGDGVSPPPAVHAAPWLLPHNRQQRVQLARALGVDIATRGPHSAAAWLALWQYLHVDSGDAGGAGDEAAAAGGSSVGAGGTRPPTAPMEPSGGGGAPAPHTGWLPEEALALGLRPVTPLLRPPPSRTSRAASAGRRGGGDSSGGPTGAGAAATRLRATAYGASVPQRPPSRMSHTAGVAFGAPGSSPEPTSAGAAGPTWRGSGHILPTTAARMRETAGLQPVPRDFILSSLEVAIEALPAALPPATRATLDAGLNGLMAVQVRQVAWRSLAAFIAFFLRFAPRRNRRIVDALLQEYASREQTAVAAHTAAGVSVEAKVAAAEAEANAIALERADVERRKREFEVRKAREGPIARGPLLEGETAEALSARIAASARPQSPDVAARRAALLAGASPTAGGSPVSTATSGPPVFVVLGPDGEATAVQTSPTPRTAVPPAATGGRPTATPRGGGSGAAPSGTPARPTERAFAASFPTSATASASSLSPPPRARIPYSLRSMEEGLGLHVAAMVMAALQEGGWLPPRRDLGDRLNPALIGAATPSAFLVSMQPNPAFAHRAGSLVAEFLEDEAAPKATAAPRTARGPATARGGTGRSQWGGNATQQFQTPLLYARTLRKLRYRAAHGSSLFGATPRTGGGTTARSDASGGYVPAAGAPAGHVMSCSAFYAWKAATLEAGEAPYSTMQRIAEAEELTPFQLSPTLQDLETHVDGVLRGVIVASQDVPTVAFRSSDSWQRVRAGGGGGGDAAGGAGAAVPALAAAPPLPLVMPHAVAAERDVFEPPSSHSWLITGKSQVTWAARHQFLVGLQHEDPIVAFARNLVLQVLRDNVHDAERLLDLFEPFAYLLSEPARLDAVLAQDHSFGGVGAEGDAMGMTASPRDGDAATAASTSSPPTFTQRSAASGPGAPYSVAPTAASGRDGGMEGSGGRDYKHLIPADPVISIEDCGRLLRQYNASIAALERSLVDVAGTDIASFAPAQAASPSTAGASPMRRSHVRDGVVSSRLMSRRGSEGFTTKQLEATHQLILPASMTIDLLRLECSSLTHHLLTLAHACCARVASYLDARAHSIFRGLAEQYAGMTTELQRVPMTPAQLVAADEAFDAAAMRLVPVLHSVAQEASEELNFLLRVELPRVPSRSATIASAMGGGGGAVESAADDATLPPVTAAAAASAARPAPLATTGGRSASTVQLAPGTITVNLKTPTLVDLERVGLSPSDRIGGASIETLQAAAEVRGWQRAVPELLTKVSRMHVDVRNKLEQATREMRSAAEEALFEAAAHADGLRGSLDPSFSSVLQQNVGIKTLANGVKMTVDGLVEVCEVLNDVRGQLMAAARDEITLRMPASPTIKSFAAYLYRLAASSQDGLLLPWGVAVDVHNLPLASLAVETALAATQPMVALMSLARNTVLRIDRWLNSSVFSLDRDDVTAKLREMAAAAIEVGALTERPVPPLAAFLRNAAKEGGGPLTTPPLALAAAGGAGAGARAAATGRPGSSASVDSRGGSPSDPTRRGIGAVPASGDGRPALAGIPADVDPREYLAASFGLLRDDYVVDVLAQSYARALQQRIGHFTTRYLPHIRVLCNPNLSLAQWERINSIIGARIGPPSTKQRGFFAGGGGSAAAQRVARGSTVTGAASTAGSLGLSAAASVVGEHGGGDGDGGRDRRASMGSVTFAIPTAAGAEPSAWGSSASASVRELRSNVLAPSGDGAAAGDHTGVDDAAAADGDAPGEGAASSALTLGEAGSQRDLAGGAGAASAVNTGISVSGSVPLVGSSGAAATIAALLTPAAGLATSSAAATRGPSLQSLLELYNLDEHLGELQAVSDAADRAVGIVV